MALIYKIIDSQSWIEAMKSGIFKGATVDLRDGYIHLSAAEQVAETARLYFAGQDNLLLVAFEAETFGPALKWEASRGGTLFPHVYGAIDPKIALWAKPLQWNGTAHVFPGGWTS